jgi:hypothetical protein
MHTAKMRDTHWNTGERRQSEDYSGRVEHVRVYGTISTDAEQTHEPVRKPCIKTHRDDFSTAGTNLSIQGTRETGQGADVGVKLRRTQPPHHLE